MTLKGAIMQLVELSEHPIMPVIFRPSIQKVIETISELEENPEPHWIPCSERLPEKNGVYIVSYEDAVTFLEWFNGKWFFYPSNPAREETGTITAWMSLPELYQEGERE